MKRKISVLVTLALIFNILMSVAVKADTYYTHDNDSKVLTITANVPDFENISDAPWFAIRSEVRNVLVNEGVTSIGKNAFKDMYNVKNVQLPETLTTIGENAFDGNKKLAAIVIPNGVTQIAESSFDETLTAVCVGTQSRFANQPGYKTYTAGKAGDVLIDNDRNNDAGSSGPLSWAVYGGEILVISGNADMLNQFYATTVPWKDYRETLTTVLIEYGITRTSTHLFYNGNVGTTIPSGQYAYPNIKTYIMPDTSRLVRNVELNGINPASLTRIDLPYGHPTNKMGFNAWVTDTGTFENLDELFISKRTSIGDGSVFRGIKNLKKLVFEEGFDGLKSSSNFSATFEVNEIMLPRSVTQITDNTFKGAKISNLVLLNPTTQITANAFQNRNTSDVMNVYVTKDSTVKDWAAAQTNVNVVEFDRCLTHDNTSWLLDGNTPKYIANANKNEGVNASNLSVTSGEVVQNDTITVSYDFAGGKDFSKLILSYKEGNEYREIKNVTGQNEIELKITDMYLGKELYATVLPMNTLGECGDMKTLFIGTVVPEMACTPSISVSGDTITASVTATFNKGAQRNMLGVVCQFDANNEMIGYTQTTQQFARGVENTLTFTEPISLLTNTKNIKLFIWDGTSIAENTMQSLWDYEDIDITN